MVKKTDRGHFPSLGARGVLIESHVHGPEFRTAVHAHPHYSVLYVVSGAGQCIVGQSSHHLAANTAILLPANEQHQLIDQPRKAMTIFVVYFDQVLARANKRLLGPPFSKPMVMPVLPHQAQQIRRTLRQMLHEQDTREVRFDLAMQQYLSFILLKLYRISIRTEKAVLANGRATSKQRVQTVLKHVDEIYYEPQSLSNAARMAGLSQRQFSNICRKLTGMSFIKYVNNLRIQRAGELLGRTDKPVTAVAFEVGFEELSTFYRAFKRIRRIPPLAFRQSCRSRNQGRQNHGGNSSRKI